MSSSHTFAEAFDLLLQIQSAKAKNTNDQAISIVAHLAPWFITRCPLLDDFETSYEELWSAYIADSHAANEFLGKKTRRLGHDRRYLTMALKRAHNKGWIKRAFSKKDFPLMEFSEPIGKFIEPEPLAKMLDYLNENSLKTYLQVLIASTMGMRISEILQLKKNEVDLDRREINLDPKRLKTRRARKIPILITDDVMELLEPLFYLTTGEYIFPAESLGKIDNSKPQTDNSYWWKKAREHAKIKCRFHDLRHSAITNALQKGMPLSTACKMFGCTSQVIQTIYDHLRPEDLEKFRAILGGK